MVSFKGEGHRSIKIGSLCIFAALGTKRWWSICLKVNDTMQWARWWLNWRTESNIGNELVVMMKVTFMTMIILLLQVNDTMSEVVESEDSIQHWERVLALADLMLRWQ